MYLGECPKIDYMAAISMETNRGGIFFLILSPYFFILIIIKLIYNEMTGLNMSKMFSNKLNFRLNSQCKRRLTWSPKRLDSTYQKQLPAYARAEYDVFYARLQWQGMVTLYKGSIFVITETQFAI